jgi:hypothetical protein
VFPKVAMSTDAVVALSTVAHEIPAAGDGVSDEISQFYKDIDSTYYDDGRPESLKKFEHPRGQAITPVEKMAKLDAMAELELRDPGDLDGVVMTHTIRGSDDSIYPGCKKWTNARPTRVNEALLAQWKVWLREARKRDCVVEHQPKGKQRRAAVSTEGAPPVYSVSCTEGSSDDTSIC